MKRAELQRAAGRVRIIAGRLRGSRLDVVELPGLRPSSDRVRETLFNWLAPHLHGMRCLDLFAGSGALGFEAASRGASRVVLVERDGRVATALRANAQRLCVPEVQVQQADALQWLQQPAQTRFDLVFVDPPFDAGLLQPALDALEPCLAEHSWIYVERARDAALSVPPHWSLHREGLTRDVRYALYRREPEAPATLPAVPQAQDPA